jgi:uncharacterized protein (DUF433 family)
MGVGRLQGRLEGLQNLAGWASSPPVRFNSGHCRHIPRGAMATTPSTWKRTLWRVERRADGKPCLHGTEVPIGMIFARLALNDSLDTIAQELHLDRLELSHLMIAAEGLIVEAHCKPTPDPKDPFLWMGDRYTRLRQAYKYLSDLTWESSQELDEATNALLLRSQRS